MHHSTQGTRLLWTTTQTRNTAPRSRSDQNSLLTFYFSSSANSCFSLSLRNYRGVKAIPVGERKLICLVRAWRWGRNQVDRTGKENIWSWKYSNRKKYFRPQGRRRPRSEIITSSVSSNNRQPWNRNILSFCLHCSTLANQSPSLAKISPSLAEYSEDSLNFAK